MARGLCIYCKIPVLKDDYISIPAHVTCQTRFGAEEKRTRKRGIDFSGKGSEYKHTFDFTGLINASKGGKLDF